MTDAELPTLPPGIDGNQTGTLTICFRQCSVPGVFARIKFWGGVSCDVYLNESIQFALVGESCSKYMNDASPLHITILSKDSTLVGNVFIADLSLPVQSSSRSSKGVISLRQMIIGDATFELHYRLLDGKHQRQLDFEVNQLIDQAGDSECHESKLCGSASKEKYSLISELLDICSDDMTIPTVDTSLVAATGVDPYDLWISNMVRNASSPRGASSQGSGMSSTNKQTVAAAELESSPHPISLFLSNVANATDIANAAHLRSSDATQFERSHVPDAQVPPKLEPIQRPPIWINIGVHRLSNLRIGSLINSASCLEFNLTSTEPLLSLCDLVQRNAFRGDETPIYSSSDDVKVVELTSEYSNTESVATTQVSWQVGLTSLHRDVEITLQLRSRCSSSGTQVIIGHITIPFKCKERVETLDTLDLLPRFDAIGWSDIQDSNSSSRASVGKIQLSMASGTLKQIRGLPKAHACATVIQRFWWKMRRNSEQCTSVGKGIEAPQPRVEMNNDDDVVTVDSHPPPPPPPEHSDKSSEKQIQVESSPDSLFEEWSQQSFLLVDTMKNDAYNVTASRTSAEDEINRQVDSSHLDTFADRQEVHRHTMMEEREAGGDVALNPSAAKNELPEPIQLDVHPNKSLPDLDEPKSHHRQPIDPPEENVDLSRMKRKMDQTQSSPSVPDAKRHRPDDKPGPESEPLPPLDERNRASNDMYVGEEESSDGDCRSLQSVMKSLAGVEARLKSEDLSHTSTTSAGLGGCNGEETVLEAVDDQSGLTPHTTESVKTPQNQTPCETEESAKASLVKTCDKCTSPIFVIGEYKDATTSPCNKEESAKIQSGNDSEGEEEDSGGTNDSSEDRGNSALKNDNRSTVRLDWSLNKLKRNDLFPTLSASSDRRERYGSLFASGRLLSPTRGAPRVERTRVNTNSSSYKRYLPERRKPPNAVVSSITLPFNFTSDNSDRIEKIFSGKKKKKED